MIYQRLRGTSKSRHRATHTSRGSTPDSRASAAVCPPNSMRAWSTSIELAVTVPNSVVRSSVNSVSRTTSRLAKDFRARRAGTQHHRVEDVVPALAGPAGSIGK